MVYRIHSRIDVKMYFIFNTLRAPRGWSNLKGIYDTFAHRRQNVLFTLHCARLVKSEWYIQYSRAATSDVLLFAIDFARPLGTDIVEGVRVYINKNQRWGWGRCRDRGGGRWEG